MTITATERDALFDEIARRHLSIETLEARKADALDFHDVAVWSLRSALEEAFEAGRLAAGGPQQVP